MLANAPLYAALAASDLARARAWYGEKLGVDPIMEAEGARFYRVGGVLFQIYESPNAWTCRSTCAAWVVDDLVAVMSDLRSRGVKFEDYDMPGCPRTIDGISYDGQSGMTAWFTDSEGNVLLVAQLPAGVTFQ